MRDSVLIYRSFAEAIDMLSDEDAGRLYKAISKYAMDEEEPLLEGFLLGYFTLIKPQIDANNERYTSGQKGGRPAKEKPLVSENSENQKPSVLKKSKKQKPLVSENSENQKPLVSENSENQKPKEKEKEKEKDKVKEEVEEGNPPPLPPAITMPCKDDEEFEVSQGDLQEMVDLYPTLDVMEQLRAMKGWAIGNKSKRKKKGDMPRFIYGWLNDEQKKLRASPKEDTPTENKLGTFGDYRQTSTDDEWDELTDLALKGINGRTT